MQRHHSGIPRRIHWQPAEERQNPLRQAFEGWLRLERYEQNMLVAQLLGYDTTLNPKDLPFFLSFEQAFFLLNQLDQFQEEGFAETLYKTLCMFTGLTQEETLVSPESRSFHVLTLLRALTPALLCFAFAYSKPEGQAALLASFQGPRITPFEGKPKERERMHMHVNPIIFRQP